MYTTSIAKHASDLHELADAGLRRRDHIFTYVSSTLHQAVEDVGQLVLDRSIGVPDEFVDDANTSKLCESWLTPRHTRKRDAVNWLRVPLSTTVAPILGSCLLTSAGSRHLGH